MVPGSTLMYGSSLSMVTLRPRDSRIAAREAAAIPLPREDTTPPVTNRNLVIADGAERHMREIRIIPQTFRTPDQASAFSHCQRNCRRNRPSRRIGKLQAGEVLCADRIGQIAYFITAPDDGYANPIGRGIPRHAKLRLAHQPFRPDRMRIVF